MKLANLKTCHMREAFGIDECPYFSWMIESDEQNTMQTAYSIKVTDSKNQVVWETGKVDSDQDSFIEYTGKELLSRERYVWNVTVWDNHGHTASGEQQFEMALLKTENWKASWVKSPIKRKKNKVGIGNQDPATMFRKEFELRENPVKGRVYATCHGVYQLSMNGKRVDNREFAPEHTVYKRYLCYQTYDVTKCLTQGKNVIGMYVGDGWMYSPNSLPDMKVDFQHTILFQIEVTYEDGTVDYILSDTSVQAAYGSVVSSDLYAGEVYDASREKAGWDMMLPAGKMPKIQKSVTII